jgi:hypothetical protein
MSSKTMAAVMNEWMHQADLELQELAVATLDL